MIVMLFRSVAVRGLGAAVLLTTFAWSAGHVQAADDNPRVRLVTSLGPIEVELFQQQAPQTVENFLRLVDQDFYDGLIFHRVIAGFMIQTGGYDAGMNHREPPGSVANESANGLKNATGTLAMARLTDPDSADTQFYINVDDNAHLDARPGQPGYTVFGRVVDGMETVTEIELAETTRKAGMPDVPKVPIVLEDVERL
jgi:cyclophilin family peptidyl-prolyl cis-trans isomerase